VIASGARQTSPMPNWIAPVVLLRLSNVVMTFAWYYHLKMKRWGILFAIVVSWGLAFFECCLQVPTNQMEHADFGGRFSAPQVKIIEEGITLTVFGVLSIYVLKVNLRWTDIAAFTLIFTGVCVEALGKRLG